MTADQNLDPNAWLIDEARRQYLANPASVSAEWRAYFEQANGAEASASDSTATPPTHQAPTADAPPAVVDPAPAPVPAPTPEVADPAPAPAPTPVAATTPDEPRTSTPEPDEPGEPIRGVGARIVANMEASLEVPTATSFREVPARLLEVNRKVINGYLGRTRGGKVSFTHLIGYAIVRAISDHLPAMNASFHEGADGKPRVCLLYTSPSPRD